jgi:hypothetical protein
MDRITINAVVFERDGLWIAHCLEYSLVSFAEELEELPCELMGQIEAVVRYDLERGRQPFCDFDKAPSKYWEMFEKADRETRLPQPVSSLLQVEALLILATCPPPQLAL